MIGNNFYNPYQSQMYSNKNGITWVQGVEGAKAYQLMPNSNTILLDSENDGIFYIKVSDAVGMCTLRTFKYEETQNLDKANTSQYITRTELEEILNRRLSNEQSIRPINEQSQYKPNEFSDAVKQPTTNVKHFGNAKS